MVLASLAVVAHRMVCQASDGVSVTVRSSYTTKK